MARRRRHLTAVPYRGPSIAEQLDAVYAELPKMECKGACWDSCSAIDMTEAERSRITRKYGLTIRPLDAVKSNREVRCPALTRFGQCSVYDLRPIICRIWGLVPTMRCNYGCVPEGGHISDKQAWMLMARIHEINGDHHLAQRIREMWADEETALAYFRERQRRDEMAWEWKRRRAALDGSALYIGPAGISRTPIRADQSPRGV